jgi:hypothetical protein
MAAPPMASPTASSASPPPAPGRTAKAAMVLAYAHNSPPQTLKLNPRRTCHRDLKQYKIYPWAQKQFLWPRSRIARGLRAEAPAPAPPPRTRFAQ